MRKQLLTYDKTFQKIKRWKINIRRDCNSSISTDLQKGKPQAKKIVILTSTFIFYLYYLFKIKRLIMLSRKSSKDSVRINNAKAKKSVQKRSTSISVSKKTTVESIPNQHKLKKFKVKNNATKEALKNLKQEVLLMKEEV